MSNLRVPTLTLPGARFPRALLALLAILLVLGVAIGMAGAAARQDPVEGAIGGAYVALVLWSICALPWLVRKVFFGLKLVATPNLIVVDWHLGLTRTIPLSTTTCVVFDRIVKHTVRSVEERWCVEVVTGGSEAALAPLLADRKAKSVDAVRFLVNDWGLMGAAAARGAAEWIARRTRARLLDRSGPAAVRLDPSALDLTYSKKLLRAPQLVLPATPRPPEFEEIVDGTSRSVSWRAPEMWLFWVGVIWCIVSGIGWGMAIRESVSAGQPVLLPAAEGLGVAMVGILLMAIPLGSRTRISVEGLLLRCQESVFGIHYGSRSVPIAHVEDVTWQAPRDVGWLRPARRVVIVTDEAWMWVYVRDENSARWLVGWLQQLFNETQP